MALTTSQCICFQMMETDASPATINRRNGVKMPRRWIDLFFLIFGVLGFCIISWWGSGSLRFIWVDYSGIGFGDLKLLLMPYFLSLIIITFRSIWAAIIGLIIGAIIIETSSVFWIVAVFLLVFITETPALVFCAGLAGGLAGVMLFLSQRLAGPVKASVWIPIHTIGLGIGGLGLAATLFLSDTKPFSPENFFGVLAPLIAALCIHIVWSWYARSKEPHPPISVTRIVLLLATLYLGIGVAFAASAPGRTLAAWPVAPWRDPLLRMHAGALFTPGEAVLLRGASGVSTFTVPAGWSARPFDWPAASMSLIPHADTVTGLRSLRIFSVANPDWLVEMAGTTLPFPVLGNRSVRCTVEAPAPPGLMLCRRQADLSPPSDGRGFLPWESLSLDLVLSPSAAARPHDIYFVSGRTLRGTCRRAGECNLELRLSNGGVAALEISEAQLGDWEPLVTEVDAIVRSSSTLSIISWRENLPGIR